MTTMETEVRLFSRNDTELRVHKRDDGSVMIEGHAAVFNSLSEDLGGFREIVKRGAFRESIASGADVRALVDHDPSKILGRTSAGTLRVREDMRGLKVEIDVPDTTAGRDITTSIERGDVSGMSFQFRTIEDKWSTVDGEDRRELVKAELIDVSPVTFPAYVETDTSIAERSLQLYHKQQESDKVVPTDVLRRRLDLEEAG